MKNKKLITESERKQIIDNKQKIILGCLITIQKV